MPSRAGREDQPRSPAPGENDAILPAGCDSGRESIPLEPLFFEVSIQKDDVDRGVEFGTPESVHLVSPEGDVLGGQLLQARRYFLPRSALYFCPS